VRRCRDGGSGAKTPVGSSLATRRIGGSHREPSSDQIERTLEKRSLILREGLFVHVLFLTRGAGTGTGASDLVHVSFVHVTGGKTMFPLEDWFDLSKPISRDMLEIAEAQMALWAAKDGDDPRGAEVSTACRDLRAAARAHNAAALGACLESTSSTHHIADRDR